MNLKQTHKEGYPIQSAESPSIVTDSALGPLLLPTCGRNEESDTSLIRANLAKTQVARPESALNGRSLFRPK